MTDDFEKKLEAARKKRDKQILIANLGKLFSDAAMAWGGHKPDLGGYDKIYQNANRTIDQVYKDRDNKHKFERSKKASQKLDAGLKKALAEGQLAQTKANEYTSPEQVAARKALSQGKVTQSGLTTKTMNNRISRQKAESADRARTLPTKILENKQKAMALTNRSSQDNPTVKKILTSLVDREILTPDQAKNYRNLNDLEQLKNAGIDLLPKERITVMDSYDDNNSGTKVAVDLNNPSKKPRILGQTKREIQTDELGRKWIGGKRFGRAKERKEGFNKLSEIDSPKIRLDTKKSLTSHLRSNKLWHKSKEQGEALSNIRRQAELGKTNPLPAQAITVLLANIVGLTSQLSDRDLAIFQGSNDWKNWMEKRYDAAVNGKVLTQKDYENIASFSTAMEKSVREKQARLKREAATSLEPLLVSPNGLSKAGLRSTIDQIYTSRLLDNKASGSDSNPPSSEDWKKSDMTTKSLGISDMKPGTVFGKNNQFRVGDGGAVYVR